MNISAIALNNFKIQNSNKINKINKNEQNNYSNIPLKLPMPTASQMLAFMGGYSLDLFETFNSIKDEQYPPEIQEKLLEEVINGNPDNKTLYDVHFDKYKGVLDCFSLDELKEKFPEFSDVESAYEVNADKDSFVGKFQTGELDLFTSYEDLTLQLIKLYWGQGFSLSDLSKYVAENSYDKKGINLHYALKDKLNIPLMNSRYANILKLSNKEYNEKFTSEMSIKRKEAKEEREQKAQGEVVIIPRGPLSPSHKQHISESLKKHYALNPEKIYAMSERQKAFYEQHPERKEEMSRIMFYAWNKTDEGKSILKYLNKFIKKHNGSTVSNEELILKEKMDEKKQSALGAFWQKNGWAKEKMSVAIKKAMSLYEAEKRDLERLEAFKTVKGERMVFNLGPSKLAQKIKDWGAEHGIDTKDLVILKGVLYFNEDDDAKETDEKNIYVLKGKKLVERYLQSFPNHADLNTVCMHNVLLNFERMLKKENHKLPECLRKDPGKIQVMKFAYNFACDTYQIPVQENLNFHNANKEISGDQINMVYSYLMYQAGLMGCEELAEFMDKELDKAYEVLKDLPKFQ